MSDAVEGLELSVASESATLENASVAWSVSDTNGYFAINGEGVVTPAQSLVNVPAGEYGTVITASRDNGGFNPETISGTLTVTITIEAAAYTIAGNEQASYDLAENATTDTVLVGLSLVVQDTSPQTCLLYTSPSPRDRTRSRMPSSA